MTTTLSPDVYQDDIAVALARVMTVANKRARELGVDLADSLISVAQHPQDGVLIWRISYGPRSYIGRRGGDLSIDIEPDEATIKQVLRGQ